MRSHTDHYIHELTASTITTILKNDPWKVGKQTITSAITNDNDLKEPDPQWIAVGENTAGTNAFSDIQFDNKVKRILDVGGGKYDFNRNYMQHSRGIELLVWDPYNRSFSHNIHVQSDVLNKKVDAVTSMSVLNVIPEPEVRLAHINTLKAALLTGGKAYFKIWPGEAPLKGSYLPSATESYYQANAYADRFVREIEIVFGVGNVEINKKVSNLIVATKLTEDHINQRDILSIQKKSEKELFSLMNIRKKSIDRLYSSNNIMKVFTANFSFFKKMENELLEKHRHDDMRIQDAYDNRLGVVLHGSR